MPSGTDHLTFGELTIDLRAFTVWRAGARVDLEPKAFDLLLLLAQRPGELVTKQEILDRIWKDTAVTDNALTRIVAQLRKGIGDDAREARYIATVPTRGYRWIAEATASARPVETVVAPQPEPMSPALHPGGSTTGVGRIAIAGAALVAAAVLAGAVRVLLQRGTSTPPAVTVLTTSQVTVSRGLDAFPAFAPDGQTLAFASDRTGAFEIYTRSLDLSAAERAVTSDRQHNVQPAWSPDGSRIAYHSMARGGIWVVPASGGAPQQVVEFGSHPQWSPDGRRIAFQSDALTDVTPTAFGATAASVIWTVGADGDGRRPLTRSGRPAGGHAAPAWSPDGKRIVFAAYGGATTSIWSAPAAGGAAEQLVAGEKHLFEPQLSTDGRWLYAATATAFVFRVPLSPENGRPDGDPEWLATPGVTASRYLRLSPDGERLALSGLTLRSSLVALALDPRTGLPTGQPAPLSDDASRRKTAPSFSPDGRRIAFTAARVGAGPDVWVFDTDSRSETPITGGNRTEASNPVAYLRPSWFPGGDRVGFVKASSGDLSFNTARITERRETAVLALNARDGDPEDAATEPSGATDVALSPDGQSIAYSAVVRATGLPRLYVRRLDGGAPRPLAEGEAAENFPAWSPDGRTIAFELNTGDATNLAVHAVDGGATRRVTNGPGHFWVHAWAPDNDHVAVARQKDGVWNVWAVSTATGTLRALTRYTRPSVHVRYPAWSPRGDQIVYEFGDVQGNVWVSRLP